ncbi:Unknown protein sequence [Pseudomonas amygdali pv. sesami]|nr:Unknown protein sequence [Pseudomonas amygdali pv. sesami]
MSGRERVSRFFCELNGLHCRCKTRHGHSHQFWAKLNEGSAGKIVDDVGLSQQFSKLQRACPHARAF